MAVNIPPGEGLDRFGGFSERFLTDESGRPLMIEAFQRQVLADYFDGARETVVLLSKKNGKTSLTMPRTRRSTRWLPSPACAKVSSWRCAGSMVPKGKRVRSVPMMPAVIDLLGKLKGAGRVHRRGGSRLHP
jgi:hypothetical protein